MALGSSGKTQEGKSGTLEAHRGNLSLLCGKQIAEYRMLIADEECRFQSTECRGWGLKAKPTTKFSLRGVLAKQGI